MIFNLGCVDILPLQEWGAIVAPLQVCRHLGSQHAVHSHMAALFWLQPSNENSEIKKFSIKQCPNMDYVTALKIVSHLHAIP